MSFFKKIFSPKKKASKEVTQEKPRVNLPLDESFVTHFTANKGKFLYCVHQENVNQNLANIFEENSWENALCFDNDLEKMLMIAGVNSTKEQTSLTPFFTTCEHLIAKDGSLLFTSNQLKEIKYKSILNNKPIPIKEFNVVAYKKNGKLAVKRNIVSNNGLNVIILQNYGEAFILDDYYYNSVFVQMFIFENYDKNLFEPVILNPLMKIYKIK